VHTVAGVHVHFITSDEYRISLILLKLEKGKIVIVTSDENMENYLALHSCINKSTPLWLSITGRPVISKKLQEDPGNKYLHHVLPNAKEADFTISLVHNKQGEVFVSVLRNESLEKVIRDLHDAGFSILGYSIGVASVDALFQYELMNAQTICIPGYKIVFSDGGLTEISSDDQEKEEKYTIAGEPVSNHHILPYATALYYLLNYEGFDTVVSSDIHPDEESYVFKRINRYFALGSLVFIFLLLLVNFFIFNSKRSENKALSDKLAYYQTFFIQRDSLRSEIAIKTSLINQVGLRHNTRYGFYTDRIASAVPEGIVLDELIMNPAEDKIKANKAIHFYSFIRVKGESKGSIVLNEWIKKLNQYNWIKDIEIISFEKTDNTGEFEFQIFY